MDIIKKVQVGSKYPLSASGGHCSHGGWPSPFFYLAWGEATKVTHTAGGRRRAQPPASPCPSARSAPPSSCTPTPQPTPGPAVHGLHTWLRQQVIHNYHLLPWLQSLPLGFQVRLPMFPCTGGGHCWGRFPPLRMSTQPKPSSWAGEGPNRKPREFRPTVSSILLPWIFFRWFASGLMEVQRSQGP